MSSFVQRLIEVSITLASNTRTNQPNSFLQGGVNVGSTVKLNGLRASVRIENAGTPVGSTATVRVWGLTPSLMAQLATLGLVLNLVPKNQITISAGDAGGTLSAVFSGTIQAAYGDYAAQPDVPFIFECNSVIADAVLSVPPTSFTGSTDVATIMSGFARQLGVGFENNGISAHLSNPYFRGSVMDQARKCANDAHIEFGVFSSTLAIWPKGGNRNTPNVPVISPANGLISYPSFTPQGILLKTLFNPQISFGGLIEVQSSLLSAISASQQASAAEPFPTRWTVNKLDLALDSMLPKGQWMSTIYAYNPGYAPGILPSV